ncbi:MAG TPA: sigma-70 family RNA polymerase sigma factor [Minicystis sp.]|nr:sigma-70 family RNA polymerase sigma factor [Minicystis sp.]
MTVIPAPELTRHERLLWGLCYRMTGSAADADDLVQDTFVRALERPPAEAGDVRPWLVKVALNLAKDRLRARRRRAYKGPWLPSVVPTDDGADAGEALPSFDAVDEASPAHRYDLVESVQLAFLLALEALSPTQRAVVLLCDVFERPVKEAAEALGISEANVKVVHHRARKALAAYDRDRVPRSAELTAKTRDVLRAFAGALASGDQETARALLADDAVSLNDGGGRFVAAGVPLVGKDRILKGTFGVLGRAAPVVRVVEIELNGAPALLVDVAPQKPNVAPRIVLQVELDVLGKIRRIYNLLAPDKLTALDAR